MKKYRYEIILFIVDAICMILELVASRILSPYFGNSNVVWTSVIGIILLSGSIGNYFGGILADKDSDTQKLKIILTLSTITVFLIPLIQEYVITNILYITKDIKVGAILATILLFFIPSFLMGLLTPIIVKLKLDTLDTAGQVSGKINAIATIGGIVGTFFGGFFLIPNFGSIHILFILTITLILLIPLVDFKLEKKEVFFYIIIIATVIVIMLSYIFFNNQNSNKVLEGDMNSYVSYDTQYGRILIYNTMRNDKAARILNIDSGYESATYIDEENWNELVFEYAKYYDLMFDINPDIKDTLMIGGAGYSYPKYFISNFENANMDVVEIDGEITEIAKKYFYLDKLIEEYDIEKNNRLQLITDDGRTYLNRNNKKYDAILNDAFAASTPAKTLTTLEAVQRIKNSLNENGIYLTNIISSLEGENSKFLRAEVNTLNQMFKNVYIFPCRDANDLENVQNIMVIATDNTFDSKSSYQLQISENEIIITDDYCPIDTLIPKI